MTSSAGLAELRAGDRLGRYRVVGLIGRGATGNVYRAVDEQLLREVALKLLAPEINDADDTEMRALAAQRMVREARAAAAFSHPNAVAVFDAGELDGTPFLAMELVHGKLLRALVGDASVPLEDRLRWLGDVARALAAAHRAGLVHRDVKPDNVIVGDDGVVKLLDFGVARRLPRSDGGPPGSQDASITIDGALVGTPAYMSPEQLRGERVDGRADQFSWAVTAYELISGKKPWTALSSPALIAAIIGREADWVTATGLSRPVAETVMRALSKAADERFASMDALLEALAGRTPAKRPPPKVSLRLVQTVKSALGPAVFFLLFAAAAVGAWWYTRVPEPVEPVEPALPPAPSGGTAAPSGGAAAPSSGAAAPSSGAAAPSSGAAAPSSGAAAPSSGAAAPSSGAAAPSSGAAAPSGAPTGAAPAAAPSGATTAPAPAAALPASVTAPADAPLRFPCPPAARRAATADDIACAAGQQTWCAPDGRPIACCAAGLVPSGAACACPPGGSRAHSDCAPPATTAGAYTAALTRAAQRAYLGCMPPDADRLDLALDLFIDPDGRAFDALLVEAYSADARLQRCVIDRLRALRLPPPPDGFARLTYGRR